MNKRITLIIALIVALGGYAQTDELNYAKYWNFRNNFRQNFIKIGIEDGESIPAAMRKPISCKNNIDGTGDKGLIRWGDGMIFQGHYIGFLATEYRLLKNRGEDVRAVLNELYYALNAINRADKRAEPIITKIPDNGLPFIKGEDLNGFYVRDDVPEFMYKNWENAPIQCRCTTGSSYFSDNTARSNEGVYTSRAGTDAWSTPSLDQLSSLLVGLTVCNKLLEDGIYVKPTADDPVMNISNEVKQITNRLINYAFNHNWLLLDEWGWPVGNGGGDLSITAYPITVIGNNITGNNYVSTIKRQVSFYRTAQIYYSLPTDEAKAAMWDTLGFIKKNQINHYSDDNPWPNGLPGLSNFEAYQLESGGEEFSTNFFGGWWEFIIPSAWPDLVADWEDDHKFNETFSAPIKWIKFDNLNIKSYNTTIMFNLGVASGVFNNDQVFNWGVSSKNYQLVLINALLKNELPAWGGKAFYQNYLNSMPHYGGFKFAGQEWYSADSVGNKQIIWSPGWGGEYKWNDPETSNNASGHEGQSSALDYMYYHNLYHLVYGDDIAQEFVETYDCFCGSVSMDDIYPLQSETNDDIVLAGKTLSQVLADGTTLHSNTVKQLSFLDFCTENVFSGPSTASTIDLIQLFDDYHAIGISLNNFQTQEFTINDGGIVNIESRLIICNTKELTVESGGKINVLKGEILIKPGAKLIIEGHVWVAPGTKIIVEEEGEIIIRNGGVLENSGYIQIKKDASLTYQENATLKMQDDRAEIHFDGGDLKIGENALFTFEKGTTQSGQLRFSKAGEHIFAEDNTRFLLQGNGNTDPILILDKKADFWIHSDNLLWIVMTNGEIILDSNARLVAIQKYTATNIHFKGLDANRGLAAFDETNVLNCVLDEVPIYAPLFYKGAGMFNMTFSEINNTTSEIMVKIKGMGYTISHTIFNGDAVYMFSAQNTIHFSEINHTTYNGTLSTVGVIDNSNAEVLIKKCDFNTLYAGVHKIDGKIDLKCNTFSDFKYAGILGQNNCIVNMSSNSATGYNTFAKNDLDFGNNIALWNAKGIRLNDGYNYFDDQGSLPLIKGTLNIPSPPEFTLLIFSRANQWNSANTVPLTSDFNVINTYTGNPVTFATVLPNSTSCPVDDDDDDDIVSEISSFIPSGGNGEEIINTLHFTNTPLSDALDQCISSTKRYDEANSDLEALSLFEEVLINYPSMNDTINSTSKLVQLGVQNMKNTLEYTFHTKQITRAENTTVFHTAVQSYVNVLNAITSVSIDQDNYQQQFYWEMDKAHLFHLLGKDNLSLLLLKNTENCGLDSNEQTYINHWKFELEQEIKKKEYGFQAAWLDSNWVDTSRYENPIRQSYGGFGSQIISISDIQFYNCFSPQLPNKMNNSQTQENTFDFSIYPNPNNGIFTVQYNLPENSKGKVYISSLDGKKIYEFECQTGNRQYNVEISNQETGVYLYTYFINEDIVKTGRFVIH